ncbi:hypothetical protein LNP18_06505 [Leuconostoc citreum]|uniref:hypothetical protein n=1 Tax=Leuconostoc citreum TaxID=33964 RepID=UPI00200B267A|nr:hypothetical protein [Leuconostoc citreum]MCK8605755.1 hypothetical protein [Leuconostoc citreum]
MNDLTEISEKIKQLFTKQHNTIYTIRLVYNQYDDEVNIFFEQHKIGFPTKSKAIGRLPGTCQNQLLDIKNKLQQETKVTVMIK